MINYELAKKLKDAGFPQYPGILEESKKLFGDVPFFPSLSELIEACGEHFTALLRTRSGDWYTEHYMDGLLSDVKMRKSPEEAVANLWLELNKK